MKLTSPGGHSISFEHDTRSRVAMVATDTAQTVRYAYDAGGRLTGVTAGDHATRFGYDDLNLTTVDVSGTRVLAEGLRALYDKLMEAQAEIDAESRRKI